MIKKYIFIFITVIFILIPAACSETSEGEENEKPEPELIEPVQLPEAMYFDSLELTKPLKDYGHGNPVMTQAFGADPNVLVWEDRLYLYMTADSLTGTTMPPGGQSNPNDYSYIKSLRVLSTADLVNWTQHPDLKMSEISSGSWISNTWAPALAAKDMGGGVKKVFLYFSNSGGGTGVISADHPLGPWTSPRNSNIVSGSTPGMTGVPNPFDPAVLVDDDNRAYLYVGGGTPSGGSTADFTSNHPNPDNIRVFELNDDMISLKSSAVKITLPFTFEASEINKISGLYYYSFSSNPQVNHYATRPDQFPAAVLLGDTMSIGYATSDSPIGPFTLRGAILHNPGRMFSLPYNNNHHKMFEFRNKWYVVYHTKLLMAANPPLNPPSGSSNVLDWNYRSTNIDAVTFQIDGSINLVNGSRTGVAQSGRFDPYKLTDAATMAVMAGLSTGEYTSESGRRVKVGDINSGDWLALRGVNFGSTGAMRFYCRVNPLSENINIIQIRIGGLDGIRIGYVVIEPGISEYTVNLLQPKDEIQPITGIHDLVFIFYGSGYDFEQWQFLH